MITEIPTQSRRLSRYLGTVLCIIVAAGASALILTAPVWSADDLAALPSSAHSTAASPSEGPSTEPAPRGCGS